jgi:hypothetical protein
MAALQLQLRVYSKHTTSTPAGDKLSSSANRSIEEQKLPSKLSAMW